VIVFVGSPNLSLSRITDVECEFHDYGTFLTQEPVNNSFVRRRNGLSSPACPETILACDISSVIGNLKHALRQGLCLLGNVTGR